MAGLVLRNVTKRFGTTTAVDEVDLEIPDKEFVVLVGPSGCGKTTILRMIAGLEEITDGEIYIGERLINDVEPKDRDIAMVFQNYALYPHMNVYRNMAFALEQRKIPRDEIRRRVHEAAHILGIEEFLQRKPRMLSGGQQQRVAMGRAIVRQPQVFLFDEPLSNLDAKLRVQMRAEISKLHDRLQTTIVYVTHDQIEAMTLADRMVILRGGRVMDQGHPLEVYRRPRNMFVAGFIGSPEMNFFPMEMQREDGRLFLQDGSLRLAVPESRSERYERVSARRVVLGMRPQYIHDAALTQQLPGMEPLQANVEVVEPIGDEILLLLSKGEAQFRAIVSSDCRARPNSSLELLFDMNYLHLFDAETEERID